MPTTLQHGREAAKLKIIPQHRWDSSGFAFVPGCSILWIKWQIRQLTLTPCPLSLWPSAVLAVTNMDALHLSLYRLKLHMAT
jgi:hypothetical protein